MRIFAVDDEPEVLKSLHEAIRDAVPEAEILDFPRSQAAVNAFQGEYMPEYSRAELTTGRLVFRRNE